VHGDDNLKSCSFFDVDGTLLDGFIIQRFPRFLADAGVIQTRYPDAIDQIITEYSEGTTTYRSAAEQIPKLYGAALLGHTEDEVQDYARTFMQQYVPRTLFPYAKELVKRMHDVTDVVVALSGSPVEAVSVLDLGFDVILGSTFETTERRYTGHVASNLILGEVKAECTVALSRDMGIDLARSIAFGDTEQDAPLLHLVKLPIAVTPNQLLQTICHRFKWKILTHDDLTDVPEIIRWLRARINEE
jgi:HAD superfamily hydrolase (TIGR01490 family)